MKDLLRKFEEIHNETNEKLKQKFDEIREIQEQEHRKVMEILEETKADLKKEE